MLYLFWGAYAQSFFASASCFYLKLCHFLVVHLYLKVDAHTFILLLREDAFLLIVLK